MEKNYLSMPPPTKKIHLNSGGETEVLPPNKEFSRPEFSDDDEEEFDNEEIDKDEILREILEAKSRKSPILINFSLYSSLKRVQSTLLTKSNY